MKDPIIKSSDEDNDQFLSVKAFGAKHKMTMYHVHKLHELGILQMATRNGYKNQAVVLNSVNHEAMKEYVQKLNGRANNAALIGIKLRDDPVEYRKRYYRLWYQNRSDECRARRTEYARIWRAERRAIERARAKGIIIESTRKPNHVYGPRPDRARKRHVGDSPDQVTQEQAEQLRLKLAEIQKKTKGKAKRIQNW